MKRKLVFAWLAGLVTAVGAMMAGFIAHGIWVGLVLGWDLYGSVAP